MEAQFGPGSWGHVKRNDDEGADPGDAIYFSLVTFTTLGFGDFTLAAGWRVIGAIEAANDIILCGWTTAIIVAVAQRVFADANGSTDPSVQSEKRLRGSSSAKRVIA